MEKIIRNQDMGDAKAGRLQCLAVKKTRRIKPYGTQPVLWRKTQENGDGTGCQARGQWWLRPHDKIGGISGRRRIIPQKQKTAASPDGGVYDIKPLPQILRQKRLY